jgi:hypothetical protein
MSNITVVPARRQEPDVPKVDFDRLREARVDPERTYASWGDALRLPGVRGLVVGRSLLYPMDGDVAAHVDIASRLVHGAS